MIEIEGVSGVKHKFQYFDQKEKIIVELYSRALREIDVASLTIKLLDVGIDRSRKDDGYKVFILAPSIDEAGEHLIGEWGYKFIEIKNLEKYK